MNGNKIEMMHPLKSDKRGASKKIQNFRVDKLELLFYYIAKQMYYKGVGAVNGENVEMYLALSDKETTMQEIRNQIQELFLRLGPEQQEKAVHFVQSMLEAVLEEAAADRGSACPPKA